MTTTERWHPNPPTALVRDWIKTASDPENRNDTKPRLVRVAGKVRGFLGTSGLRFACSMPDCDRFLENAQCRIHGKVKFAPRLHAKLLLDVLVLESDQGDAEWRFARDGYAPLILPTEGVEALANFPLDIAQAEARAAMTVDVTADYVETKLIGRTIAIHAWLVPVDEDGYALHWSANITKETIP